MSSVLSRDAASRNPTSGLTSLAAEFLRDLFGESYAREFAIRFWDGSTVRARARERFVLLVNEPFALRAAFMPPLDLRPAEAFAQGWIEVEGDIEAAVDVFMRVLGSIRPASFPLLMRRLLQFPKAPRVDQHRMRAELLGQEHSRRRDAAAISHHYDRPATFYGTFLDPNLVYSCGYWDDGVQTLAQAQDAKIDYVLRKVRLQPNEELLDIGCGWGALVMRAAERFGARATGITLSRTQYEEAQERITARGLGDRCRIELRDYRDLGARTFDKIVSVGMVEHVGASQLAAYFGAVLKSLRPGGLFLNHGIAEQSEGRRGGRATGFIRRHIFPDGDIVAVGEVLRSAEHAGFEVRDVENLREHYALTLRAWIENLECNRDQMIAATNEMTYRAWRLYLAGSAQGFASGRLGVFQSLLARPTSAGWTARPRTRRDLYEQRTQRGDAGARRSGGGV